jgi:uncharacterized membrane protein
MQNTNQDTFEKRVNKSNGKLAIFTGLWLFTTALLAFGPKLIWEFNFALTLFAVLLNIAAGVFMIFANVQHLKRLDELGRKIFLESAAITLGVLMVFGVCYELLSYAGEAFTFTPRISHMYFVMGITFIVSVFVSNRKYK